MPHFYIYKSSNNNTSEDSTQDLRQLCEQVNVKSDVYLTDFLCNPDQIPKHSVIVVPGGKALSIVNDIRNSRWSLNELTKKYNLGYFGICAGAYIAPVSINYCMDLEKPKVGLKSRDYSELSLGLTDLTESYGPFSADNDGITSGQWNVHLTTTDSKSFPCQLYISGCGFRKPKDPNVETVGYYTGQTSYTFQDSETSEDFSEFSFALKFNSDSIPGGMLLSGTHMEAVVQDSQLLGHMKEQVSQLRNFGLFQDAREEMLRNTLCLLNHTFNSFK